MLRKPTLDRARSRSAEDQSAYTAAVERYTTAGDPRLSPRAWHRRAVHRHANRRPPGP